MTEPPKTITFRRLSYNIKLISLRQGRNSVKRDIGRSGVQIIKHNNNLSISCFVGLWLRYTPPSSLRRKRLCVKQNSYSP
jgi:hypothetical protein